MPIETAPAPLKTFEQFIEENFGDGDEEKPWHVVLLDDDHHTYDYVIEMLNKIFGYSLRKAFLMACEVDEKKRVIVWTGHLEKAEAYQEEIHDYGPDWRMESSKGSMTAVLERAP